MLVLMVTSELPTAVTVPLKLTVRGPAGGAEGAVDGAGLPEEVCGSSAPALEVGVVAAPALRAVEATAPAAAPSPRSPIPVTTSFGVRCRGLGLRVVLRSVRSLVSTFGLCLPSWGQDHLGTPTFTPKQDQL